VLFPQNGTSVGSQLDYWSGNLLSYKVVVATDDFMLADAGGQRVRIAEWSLANAAMMLFARLAHASNIETCKLQLTHSTDVLKSWQMHMSGRQGWSTQRGMSYVTRVKNR
jgi:hypothetical protein